MVLRFLFCCYQSRGRRTRIRFGLFLPEFAQLLRQIVDRKLISRSMSLINKKWHLFVAAKQKNWSPENHNPAIVVEWVRRRKEGEEAQHRTKYFPPKCFHIKKKNPFRTTHPPYKLTLPTPPSKPCFRAQFPREKNSTWRMPLCYFRRSFLNVLWPCFAFVVMEGTSNKSHKSRLFTSNVLLQKDELDEVGFTFLYNLFEIDRRS